MESLEHLIRGIMTDGNTESQLASTIGIRDMVTTDQNLLEKIYREDVVSRFVLFLSNDDFPPQLKHEAAWLLAKMTMQEDKQILVDCGTVPLFLQLINADVEEDRSLAVWALANIACESIERRDLVLSNGALMTLLSQCEEPNQTTTMLKAATGTLLILYSWTPCLPLAQIQPALPVLKRFLQSENSDLHFSSSALLACFFEGSDSDETRKTLMNLGVIPRLIELFGYESAEIHKEVIRTIFYVLSWENRDHSQVVIDQKPIPSIASYLTKTEDTHAKTQSSYIVYRIASWDQNQHEEVIASGVLIPLLQDHDSRTKICCVGTISIVTNERNDRQIRSLVSQGCIEALCDALTSPDQRIIQLALSALEDILGVGLENENVVNPGRGGGFLYARKILGAGGLEKINALKASQDEFINEIVMYIVAEYFNEDKKWW